MIAFALASVTALSLAPATEPMTLESCAAMVRVDAVAAERAADRWLANNGAAAAQRCRGLALVAQDRFDVAAEAFEAAAEASGIENRAEAWAEAGNAWLGAGNAARARKALDAAIAANTLAGPALGEARLDRARALVALGDSAAARVDLDAALVVAPDDPLAWLLSATLARRTGDLTRAKTDIAEALRRSPDDAAVQLEAGNVAARAGDESGARVAWSAAVRLAPDRAEGRSAAAALTQFEQR